MFKLTVFIPQTHTESVKNALFDAGAGRYKNYDRCSFDLKGTGQFRALEGANPHIGEIQKVEYVEEVRVEMIVQDDDLLSVIDALKTSHPYEEPAYDIIQLFDVESLK